MATSTTPDEMGHALVTKAGTPVGAGHTNAANVLAGTKGLELVHALNILAGNKPGFYAPVEGCLNQLAGTKGLGENGAASRYAGIY